MKPPKCRLCGHEHWNNQSHVFRDVVNAVVNKVQRGTPLDQPLIKVVIPPKDDRRDSSERRQTKWQQKNRKRYNAKMREYMRLRRAGFIGIAYG